MVQAHEHQAFNWRALWLSAASICFVPGFAAAQQQGADQMRRTYGVTPDVEASPYQFPGRDQNGVRLVVNGRPIDLGGARSAGPARLADPNGGVGGRLSTYTRSGRLSNSSLSSTTAVGNNVTISNVRNSSISITQINYGRVTATTNAPR
jgi:hypothetical protein